MQLELSVGCKTVVVLESYFSVLLVFSASRHLYCNKDSSCANMKFSGGSDGGTAMHGSCVVSNNRLSCETLVLKHCDEVNSTGRFSADKSECVNVSSPLICCHSSVSSLVPSSQNSLIDTATEPLATLEKSKVSDMSLSDQIEVSESSTLHSLTLPCSVSDIQVTEENTANSARNDVSVSVTETMAGPLLDECSMVDLSNKLVSYMKESFIAKDLRSLRIDGVNATTALKNQHYICHTGHLPEINKIHCEAGKSVLEGNSSDSFPKEHCAPLCVESSPTSELCLPICDLSDVTMAADSQNGLSAVGQFVSCFKSMTKSPKTTLHNGLLHACNLLSFLPFKRCAWYMPLLLVCLSVFLSVTCWSGVKTAKHRMM